MEKDRKIITMLQEELHLNLRNEDECVQRSYQFPEAEGLIKVAIGMRRSGKTYFLFQTMRQLLKKEIGLDQVLYINFEDDRILPLDHKAMGQLIDAWYSVHPENHHRLCHIFLDEVQNVEGWALVLRRVLDTKQVQIYVTGSSAKLLSKEIATSLRGRSLAMEILPYSYTEYLAAHHFSTRATLDHRRHDLEGYMHIGGFPGIQALAPNEQREMLQNYVETVILRDIVERYQVSNVPLLKYLIQALLKNTSALFSINKFYNDIKSQGYPVGKDTLHAYLTYLEDAFLIFTVPIFTESLRRRQTTPKKIYAIDNGLAVACTFNLSDNRGKLFENQIYLDLRRHGKKVYYYQTCDGYEIDFVTQDKEGKFEILQAVWDSSDPSTLEREERALRQAEQELGFPGRIIDWEAYLSGPS